MINNRIKAAKFKLEQHRVRGAKSQLSVHQVAKLMDTVRLGEEMEGSGQSTIFFNWN